MWLKTEYKSIYDRIYWGQPQHQHMQDDYHVVCLLFGRGGMTPLTDDQIKQIVTLLKLQISLSLKIVGNI